MGGDIVARSVTDYCEGGDGSTESFNAELCGEKLKMSGCASSEGEQSGSSNSSSYSGTHSLAGQGGVRTGCSTDDCDIEAFKSSVNPENAAIVKFKLTRIDNLRNLPMNNVENLRQLLDAYFNSSVVPDQVRASCGG